MAFINEKTQGVGKRTIDYERNAILKATGGIGATMDTPRTVFDLTWNDMKCELIACSTEKIGARMLPNGGPEIEEVHWLIESFRLPVEFSSKRNEFIKLMLEALTGYGYLGRVDWHGKTTVDIHPNIKLNL